MHTSAWEPEEKPGAALRSSLLGAAVLLLVAAVFTVCLRPIPVTDFWWQAKTGELIVTTGRIPSRDPFSWTAAGSPWVVHEWLTEVLFHGMVAGLPREALLFYKSGLAAVACALVLVRGWRRSGSGPLAIGTTLLAALVVREYADLRPQMLTFGLLAGMLLVLDEHRAGRVRRLPWLLPPLFVLWANLHGGAVVGLVLLTLWTVGDILGRRFLGEEGRGNLLGATAACWLAAILNPNGWHVYTYPFQVLGHPEVQDYIVEWFSPNFHSPALRAFAAMLLLTMAALALGRSAAERPAPLGETLVLLAMAYAALTTQRNTAPFALAAAPVVAAGGAGLWQSPGLAALRRHCDRRGARIAGLAALCGGLFMTLNYYRPPVGPARWVDYAIAMDDFPVEAVRWLKQGRWPGPLYNDYVWGGYLAFELYPRRRVFIDGRAEVYYPNGVFDDEMKIHRVSPGWDEALRRRGVEVVLTRSRDSLARALGASREWELAFAGKVESVFTRRRTAERERP